MFALPSQLHSRLQRLYPEYVIVHQPPLGTEVEQEEGRGEQDDRRGCSGEAEGEDAADDSAPPAAVCDAFVANAALFGDLFQWHVDGDPNTISDGPWRAPPAQILRQ